MCLNFYLCTLTGGVWTPGNVHRSNIPWILIVLMFSAFRTVVQLELELALRPQKKKILPQHDTCTYKLQGISITLFWFDQWLNRISNEQVTSIKLAFVISLFSPEQTGNPAVFSSIAFAFSFSVYLLILFNQNYNQEGWRNVHQLGWRRSEPPAPAVLN